MVINVPDGVHALGLVDVLDHMNDVVVVKAAHHMDDGVALADVAQKLVAQTRALGLAPLTRPAMSTNSTMAGVFLSVCQISASLSSRGSGTGTMPEFGSIVQKG